MENIPEQILNIKEQILLKTNEITALNKELEKLINLESIDCSKYIGKFYSAEIFPCTHRYIRVTTAHLNNDGEPVIYGTGFDKTIMLIKSSTTFSSSRIHLTLRADLKIKEITEEKFETIKQQEMENISKL